MIDKHIIIVIVYRIIILEEFMKIYFGEVC
jgi:hypothetical protein